MATQTAWELAPSLQQHHPHHVQNPCSDWTFYSTKFRVLHSELPPTTILHHLISASSIRREQIRANAAPNSMHYKAQNRNWKFTTNQNPIALKTKLKFWYFVWRKNGKQLVPISHCKRTKWRFEAGTIIDTPICMQQTRWPEDTKP